MNVPETIYFSQRYSCLRYERTYDTDVAYVRADLPYAIAKTCEAQKAEISRLIKALEDHGVHHGNCDSERSCTCGFTAALEGKS